VRKPQTIKKEANSKKEKEKKNPSLINRQQ